MPQRRDVTLLPTLLVASMTLFGFLLVWAQSDTIELTTTSWNQGSPMSPAGFNIATGGNVSIDLPHRHSTSMVPMVTTSAQDTALNMDKAPTSTASLNSATIPLPTAPTTNTRSAKEPAAITDDTKTLTPGNLGNTGSSNTIPREIAGSRAASNSSDRVILNTALPNMCRVSINVKLQSSAPKDETIQVFLKKACVFFQSLHLEDVTVTLGPGRTPISCFKN
ncbi:uncharacterized protein LOC143782946 isoform X1 [Ranitomeya variabilis]|uniref:uncharacterized protein LOC143782946 isoform X1 n=1 Tax=Ranitomeya variabilis TaxID=490064 RepID=UPI0040561936